MSHKWQELRELARLVSGYFVRGLLTLLPLAITIGVLGWLSTFVSAWIGPGSVWGRMLARVANQLPWPATVTIASTYLLVLLAVIAVGAYVSRAARNHLAEWIKYGVSRLPGMGGIYGSVDHVVTMLAKRDEMPATRARVVLARLANTTMLGLVTSGHQMRFDDRDHVMVYVPSAPVPMSGLNYLVPVDDVLATDLRFEDLVKVLVSLGAMAPVVMGHQVATQPLRDVIGPGGLVIPPPDDA